MHSFETIDLGTYRGDVYFLKGFVEPEPSPGEHYDPGRDADGYGVVLVKKGADPLGENEQIVRMDTSHGQPHLDKVYLPADADEDRKDWLEDGYTYTRMKRYVEANWRGFADLYIKYHE